MATVERLVTRGKMDSAVRVYTGDLDTSVIVSWLRENRGCEVAYVLSEVGQARLALLSDINGRKDVIGYAQNYPAPKKLIYRNIWHLSHEGDILEDPGEPKKAMHMMFSEPADAPNTLYVTRIPFSINRKNVSPASLLSELNNIGGLHTTGFKFAEPGYAGRCFGPLWKSAPPDGTIVDTLELESLTLVRESIQLEDTMTFKFPELLYAGGWSDLLQRPASLGGTILATTASHEANLQFKDTMTLKFAEVVYVGRCLDLFQKSAPPGGTIIAAGSSELLENVSQNNA